MGATRRTSTKGSQKFLCWLGGCGVPCAHRTVQSPSKLRPFPGLGHHHTPPRPHVSRLGPVTARPLAGRKVRSGVQVLPRLRHCCSAFRPQTVGRTENSDGPQACCCFRSNNWEANTSASSLSRAKYIIAKPVDVACAWRTHARHDGWCQGQVQVDTFPEQAWFCGQGSIPAISTIPEASFSLQRALTCLQSSRHLAHSGHAARGQGQVSSRRRGLFLRLPRAHS